MSADKSTFKELAQDSRRVAQFYDKLAELDDNNFIEAVIESAALREDLKDLIHNWAANRVKKALLLLKDFKEEDFIVKLHEDNDIPYPYLSAFNENESITPSVQARRARNFRTNILKVSFHETSQYAEHTIFVDVKSNGDFIWDMYREKVSSFYSMFVLTGTDRTFKGLTKEFLLKNGGTK